MPRKVLHIVGSMSRGGVESWLMHVMRNIDQTKCEFHFLVAGFTKGDYDEEILSLGGSIHYGADTKDVVAYAARFAEIERQHGPFAVVHSHVYWYSGFVLWLGFRAGIPVRIAHSHTATRAPAWNLWRKTYESLMRSLIMRYATDRIAVSQQAGEALFGRRPRKPFSLLYYGLDFTRFLQRRTMEEAKRSLGIATDRKVIGHVGRFVPVKNHRFTVECFARTVADGLNTHLLLVGDGPLLPSIKAEIESRGLTERCTFAGLQSDVVPFFAAMDLFVLPSLWEGLPLVAFEAQAAGIPVIASTGVPGEVQAIPRLVQRIPLRIGTSGWASAVSNILKADNLRCGDEPMVLQTSKFGLPVCLEALSQFYGPNAY
jgi:glycosyltransferase involved in cell wall biosynthesis